MRPLGGGWRARSRKGESTTLPPRTPVAPTRPSRAPHLQRLFEQIAADAGHPNPRTRAREVLDKVHMMPPTAESSEYAIQLLRDYR